MKLTNKEQETLLTIAENGMAEMGGSQPSDLLDDNFSWFNRKNITDYTDFSSHVASGLMSSLGKKGLISPSGDPDGLWSLNEEGIHLSQELWDTKNNK